MESTNQFKISRRTASEFWCSCLNRSAQPICSRLLKFAPVLIYLTLASAARAQGTMDFSGAQTLMGTFKTFAIYAGAVICFGGLIFAGIRMMIPGRNNDVLVLFREGFIRWTRHFHIESSGKPGKRALQLLDLE